MSKQPDRPIDGGTDNDLNIASIATATEEDDVQGHEIATAMPEDEEGGPEGQYARF